MTNRWDVAVVGAGPAGSTAARQLAEGGYSVILLEKKTFPRPKTCASWVNALALRRFPYLKEHGSGLFDSVFYGLRFYDADIERFGEYREYNPVGHLTLRSRFDHGLAKIAMAAGVTLREGAAVLGVEEVGDGVQIRLEGAQVVHAKFAVGADGSSSRVALSTGLRPAWTSRQYVLCGNEDIPCPPERIRALYGDRPQALVSLQFQGLGGYGWVFPKREHICVGIGGRLGADGDIRRTLREFFEVSKKRGLLPDEISLGQPGYAIDPAGAVHGLETVTKGRVVLIGDAAGFVSGSTGEGIYPGMVSGAIAADVIRTALDRGSGDLSDFNRRWRQELGHYLQPLSGRSGKEPPASRLEWIYRSRVAAGVAGRMFLYGEPPSLRTLLRSLFNR